MSFQSQEEFRFSEGEQSHIRLTFIHEQQIPVHNCRIELGRDEEQPVVTIRDSEESLVRETKTKPIVKNPKNGGKKYKKREKDSSITVSMGRPDNNKTEADHLIENKSYNDIVYHFSRFLIFLKLKQGAEKSLHSLDLTLEQNKLITKAEDIMRQDNYPGYQQQKPYFLLHPNSPHFVFNYYKHNHSKLSYTSEEAQYIMIAYLRKKGLLTSTIFHYLLDYWKDIIFLVNNPRGDLNADNIPNDDSEPSAEAVEMINNENKDQNERKSESSGKKGENATSEYVLLKEELKKDDTIAAYEIACYLHACCEKYQITINQ